MIPVYLGIAEDEDVDEASRIVTLLPNFITECP
jgi:hypothetical protein